MDERYKRLNKWTQKTQERDKRLNKEQMTQQIAQKTQQSDTKDSTKGQFCKRREVSTKSENCPPMP